MISYQEYKDSVVKFMTKFSEFAKQNDYSKSAELILAGKEKLKDDKIVIVTCGELKMGKSSMLGALLEDEGLFPVDVNIATCLITMVSYGEKENITVVVENEKGEYEEIAITREEISDYANEQKNRHNKKKAGILSIELPNEKLKNGLVFVDTPGIGSMNIEHSELTYNFLPSADLLLFVSDSAAPYYAPEIAFLKNAYRLCKNIIFVLTKKDMQHNDDIIEKKQETIEKELGIPKEKQIFIPVSSIQKLRYLHDDDRDWLEDSNFEQLENEIWNYVTENRAKIVIEPRLSEVGQEVKKIEADLILKETSFSGDKDKIRKLKDELEKLSDRRQELLSESANWQMDITKKVNDLSAELDYSIADFQSGTVAEVRNKVTQKEYFNDPYKLLNEVVALVQAESVEMHSIISEKIDKIREDFEHESGLEYSIDDADTDFGTADSDNIVFAKKKSLEKMVDRGGKIATNSFRMTAFGSFVGSAIGGVIGFVFGGPVGAVGGAKVGGVIGVSLGGAVGTAKGASEAIETVGNYEPSKILEVISKYISDNVVVWKRAKQVLVSGLTSSCIKTLRNTIKNNIAKIENDIKLIQNNEKKTAQEQQEGLSKIRALKQQLAVYTEALKKLTEIKSQVNVSPADAEFARIDKISKIENSEYVNAADGDKTIGGGKIPDLED